MQTTGCGITDVGRRRQANEDAFLVDDTLGLYVVADGMGGHRAGEVASGEAVETLHDMVRRDAPTLSPIADFAPGLAHGEEPHPELQSALRVVERAVQAATYMVYGLGEANPDRRGMGTTLSALLFRGHYAFSAQVGDSRIYLIRAGRAFQITEDHTLVAWQVKKGLITPEEAKNSRQKNVITRAVGSREYVQVDTRMLHLQPGDGFLLCSDGLHGYLRNEEIPGLYALGLEEGAARAIDLANERGGKDNITALFVRVEGARASSPPPQ